MTDAEWEKRLAAARRADVGWTSSREQQASWEARGRFDGRRRRGKRLRVFGASLGGSAALALVAMLVWPTTKPATHPGTPAALTVTAGDGSTILLDDAATVLRKSIEGASEMNFELESGGARFDVTHRPSREFRVQAGAVMVQVIGTRFYVRKVRSRCRVAVERGRVLITWPGGSTTLAAGETGIYPPPVDDDLATKDAAPPTDISGTPVHHRSAVESKQSPDELFFQADRLRAASNPAAAVRYLGELVRRFPTDSRAAAAAFTMGRLLLERLDQPRQAAAAFATARRLSTMRALAEDALAREVESLAKAGDRDEARQRAAEYARFFPDGARRVAVMRFAGLPAAP